MIDNFNNNLNVSNDDRNSVVSSGSSVSGIDGSERE
jgi:hypothetical protein